MDQKPPEISKPKPSMAAVNTMIKTIDNLSPDDMSVRRIQRSRGYSNDSKMLTAGIPQSIDQVAKTSLKSVSPPGMAATPLSTAATKRSSVEHLARQFERAATADMPQINMATKPKIGIKRVSQDGSAMRERVHAGDGPKQLSQFRDNLKKLDPGAMSPEVKSNASSPGAKLRRDSELKVSQMQQAAQAADQESDTVGSLEGKATLTRSRAINLKKRNSIKRKPSNKSTSYREYLAKSQTRKRSGNSSVLAASLKDASPYDKVKAMYRLYRQQTMIADEICNLYEGWAKQTMEQIGKIEAEDAEETTEEFQFDFASLLWKDLLQLSNEVVNILPQSTSVKNLRKVQADTEEFSRQDQSVEIFPKSEREVEAKKIGKLGRKFVGKLLAMEIVLINEFMVTTNQVPILSVPSWKIEGMSYDYLTTWLAHNNINLTDYDKEKEESTKDHEVLPASNTKVGRRTSTAQGTAEKDAVIKNEVLVLAKPSHVVTRSNMEHFTAPVKFQTANKIDTDNKGNTMVKVDFFDTDNLAYRQFFLGNEHRNYLGTTDKFGELAISIKKEVLAIETVVEEENESKVVKKKREINDVTFYRVLFRCKSYSSQLVHLLIPEADLNIGTRMSIFGKKDEAAQTEKVYKTIINTIHPKLDISKLKRIDVEAGEEIQKIEKSLLQIDEHRTAFNYKFGLLYVKDGQTNEIQWFNNVEVSPEYERFCSIIGDTIELKGHIGFTGGLDTKNGNTGQKSIYTRWRLNPKTNTALGLSGSVSELQQNDENISFEVMYHVATLLPYFANDEQQIQRKRHIGNDLVSLVFLDGSEDKLNESSNTVTRQNGTSWNVKAPFDPRCIRGQFLHVYIVVQEVYVDPQIFQKYSSSSTMSLGESNLIPAYRVFTTSNVDVPNFEPSLSDPPLYPVSTPEERKKFRDFIMAKLINAENAAFHAPKFKSLNVRTFTGLMETVWKEFQDHDGKKKSRPESSYASASTRIPEEVADSSKAQRMSIASKDAARDAMAAVLSQRMSVSSKESYIQEVPAVVVPSTIGKQSISSSPMISPSSTLNDNLKVEPQVAKKSSKSILQQVFVDQPEEVPTKLSEVEISIEQTPALTQDGLMSVKEAAPSIKEATTPKTPLKARSERSSAMMDDLASFLSEGPPVEVVVPKPDSTPLQNKRQSLIQSIKTSMSTTKQDSQDSLSKKGSQGSLNAQDAAVQMRERVQSDQVQSSPQQIARPKSMSVQQKRQSKVSTLVPEGDSDDSDDEKERKAKIRKQKQEMIEFLNSGPPEQFHVPAKKEGTLKGNTFLNFLNKGEDKLK